MELRMKFLIFNGCLNLCFGGDVYLFQGELKVTELR